MGCLASSPSVGAPAHASACCDRAASAAGSSPPPADRAGGDTAAPRVAAVSAGSPTELVVAPLPVVGAAGTETCGKVARLAARSDLERLRSRRKSSFATPRTPGVPNSGGSRTSVDRQRRRSVVSASAGSSGEFRPWLRSCVSTGSLTGDSAGGSIVPESPSTARVDALYAQLNAEVEIMEPEGVIVPEPSPEATTKRIKQAIADAARRRSPSCSEPDAGTSRSRAPVPTCVDVVSVRSSQIARAWTDAIIALAESEDVSAATAESPTAGRSQESIESPLVQHRAEQPALPTPPLLRTHAYGTPELAGQRGRCHRPSLPTLGDRMVAGDEGIPEGSDGVFLPPPVMTVADSVSLSEAGGAALTLHSPPTVQ